MNLCFRQEYNEDFHGQKSKTAVGGESTRNFLNGKKFGKMKTSRFDRRMIEHISPLNLLIRFHLFVSKYFQQYNQLACDS